MTMAKPDERQEALASHLINALDKAEAEGLSRIQAGIRCERCVFAGPVRVEYATDTFLVQWVAWKLTGKRDEYRYVSCTRFPRVETKNPDDWCAEFQPLAKPTDA